MGNKIENPAEWIGHEIEASLATDSSGGVEKELCIVSTVNEDRPISFYRVKKRGEKTEDFTEWVEAVECYNDDMFSKETETPYNITFLKLGGKDGQCPKCNRMVSSLVNGENRPYTKCRSCGVRLRWE